MNVHPLADLFPMMSDDELIDLAADIEVNGLLHPIVLDGEGTLIDGRNRLRACEIAGVEPQFTRLNGHDATAFIVSANLNRRNMTKGQRAIALAMIYPEPSKGGRGNKQSLVETTRVSSARLTQARAVLRHSRALAEQVLSGAEKLDAAIDRVRQEQNKGANNEAKFEELKRASPDLADLVIEERISLDNAYAELVDRRRRLKQHLQAGAESLTWLKSIPTHISIIESAVALGAVELALIDGEPLSLAAISDAEIREMIDALLKLSELKQAEVERDGINS